MQEFARVQRGDFSPADCIRCGRDTDLLDLGAGDIERYGRPYFCTNCFGELADKMEYVAPQELAAVTKALKATIKLREEERDAALRSTTALVAESNATPAAHLERFAHDVRNLVSALPDTDHIGDGGAGVLRAADGAETVGRDELDDGADGGVENVAARGGAGTARGSAGIGTRAAAEQLPLVAGVPEGDSGDGGEVDGAGEPDLDEWAASLGNFDDEAAVVHGSDAGD